jgi:hypothetical protein
MRAPAPPLDAVHVARRIGVRRVLTAKGNAWLPIAKGRGCDTDQRITMQACDVGYSADSGVRTAQDGTESAWRVWTVAYTRTGKAARRDAGRSSVPGVTA